MDLVCFSHLRWNFVYQRPQHLLSRFANHYRVFFIEEPVPNDTEDGYSISLNSDNVWVVVPYLQSFDGDINEKLVPIINSVFTDNRIEDYLFWYYTPMALPFTSHLTPVVTVYDCMDELSAFKNAPASLLTLEKDMFAKADVVFTGGHTLFQAKKNQHHNIYPFPSSIDKAHFMQARVLTEPADQAHIAPVRFGFYGVVDERFDIDLLDKVAAQRKDWQFIIVGPVVKIDPEHLPKHENIHYLGGRSYQELPAYLSGWDIAMVPFAINESTKYISPTKTPEYLAAGKPVISTPIQDVINPYGVNKLVYIISTPEEFIEKAEEELAKTDKSVWLAEVDSFLTANSWNDTWLNMMDVIQEALVNKQHLKNEKKEGAYV